jgi:hypothetical protein
MGLEPEPLELVPLGRTTITVRSPAMLSGTPVGTRAIIEVGEARFEGERINASAKGRANADWATFRPDGTATLDVRVLLETDDGALIYVTYGGRMDLSTMTVYSTPQFETGDERYAWLNGIQAVGKGTTDGTTLVYDVFELR